MRPRQNHFGNLLRDQRAASRKTLGDVARALECSVSFVSDVEHGRRHPFDRSQILKVAELFGVPPFELVMAAAKDRQAVNITSDREEHLEAAARLARVLDSGDPSHISEALEVLARICHSIGVEAARVAADHFIGPVEDKNRRVG